VRPDFPLKQSEIVFSKAHAIDQVGWPNDEENVDVVSRIKILN
jgi:hypothetical protein